MELAFELRDEDFRVAQRAATTSVQRLGAHWSVTLFGVLHWMCIGAFAMCVFDQAPRELRGLLLGLGFAMLGTLWAVLLLQNRRLKARFHADAGPFPQAHHLHLDDAGLTMTALNGSMRIPWSRVLDVQSLRGHLLLHFAQGTCLPIPDRAFPDPAAREAFIATLAAHRTPA